MAPRAEKTRPPARHRVQIVSSCCGQGQTHWYDWAIICLKGRYASNTGHGMGTHVLRMAHVTRARVIRVYYLYKNLFDSQ